MDSYDKKRIVAGAMITVGVTNIAYTLGGVDIGVIVCSVMVVLGGLIVASS
ncbi:hypothetical protein ND2E_0990 [Colwellia psychrerythraea]|uniref:Uncharacterized protein n=1 Tax=Colwellia psychrerythraea TaxID=28229 RepID=A0A099K6I6_COLPS|nr:hypothetical protein ND2E_0990 [Colwellia psychrerythraea]